MINALGRPRISGRMPDTHYTASTKTPSTHPAGIKITAANIVDISIVLLPATFFLAIFILEANYPEYSRIQNTVSELVWGRQGWIMAGVFALTGMLLISLSLRLSSYLRPGIFTKIGISLIFLIGVGFIIIAVFPTRAPGAAQTIKTLLHKQAANGISVAFPLACLFIAGNLKSGPEWQLARLITVLAGGIGLVLALTGGAAVFTDAPWIGAIERAIIGNGLIWLEVLGLSLSFPGFMSRARSLLEPGRSEQFAGFARQIPQTVTQLVNQVRIRR